MKFSSLIYSRLLCWMLLVIGVLIANLQCGKSGQDAAVLKTGQSGQVKKQQAMLALRYEDRIRCLQKRSDSLVRQLKVQQQQVAIYKQQVLVQKLKVQQRIARQASHRDTLQKLLDCDSLQDEVQVYIALTQAQDSLCQAGLQNLTAQLALKDSAQNACTGYADRLNLLLNASTDAQQQMEKQVSSLNKKLKRKTRVGKLLTAGLLVLSGVMLTSMTH